MGPNKRWQRQQREVWQSGWTASQAPDGDIQRCAQPARPHHCPVVASQGCLRQHPHHRLRQPTAMAHLLVAQPRDEGHIHAAHVWVGGALAEEQRHLAGQRMEGGKQWAGRQSSAAPNWPQGTATTQPRGGLERTGGAAHALPMPRQPGCTQQDHSRRSAPSAPGSAPAHPPAPACRRDQSPWPQCPSLEGTVG